MESYEQHLTPEQEAQMLAQALIDGGIELTAQDMFEWVDEEILSGEMAGMVAGQYIRLLNEQEVID